MSKHVVTVTPGVPLVNSTTGEVIVHRAVADCNLCGCIASGAASVVIEKACEHATP